MALTYTVDVQSAANLWWVVQTYIENRETSFVQAVPSFVRLAEERIYNDVQIPALRRNALGSLTANNAYLSLPSDWLANFSVCIIDGTTNDRTFLLDKDVEFIRQAYPDPTTTGVPNHYAIFDSNTLIIGPTPDTSYQVELHYYYYPQSIVDAGSSWLGNNFSNVLLYGTLREAYLYVKGEEDMVKYYEDKYQEGIALLKKLGEGKNRRDAYRSGQNRLPVT